ncbi:MAG: hypothetical protein IT328_25785 [Caldilineaceae bacterium]|nr:hypothetical protein [Caldilineaceae bacterium]
MKKHSGEAGVSQAGTAPAAAWYVGYSPDSYLGLPSDLFFAQTIQAPFEPRQPPALGGERRIDDGPILIPSNYAPSPTPLPTPLPKWALDSAQLIAYDLPSSLPVTGLAMFYNPEVMQEVLANRLAMGQLSACSECIGHVALLRAGDLNRHVWLQWADGVVEGPFLVADVAAPHHVAQLLARNWVVDVDYRTAARRGIINPVPVTVWAAPPASSQPASSLFTPPHSSLLTPTVTPIPIQN